MKSRLFFALLLSMFLITADLAAEDRIYRIGYVTSTTSSAMSAKYGKFFKTLSNSGDIVIKGVVFNNTSQLIQAIQSKQIDAAWISTFAYMKEKNTLNADAIVRPEKQGRSRFRSAIITYRDSEIKSIADVKGKGKAIAFVDRTSQAGYIYPSCFLAKNGLAETTDYTPRFLKSHDSVVTNVYLKKEILGTVYDSAIDVYLNDLQRQEIVVLAYTPETPFEPVVVSRDLLSEDREILRSLFLNYSNMPVLHDLHIDRFIPASQGDYSGYYDTNSLSRFNLD